MLSGCDDQVIRAFAPVSKGAGVLPENLALSYLPKFLTTYY
jgi:hypothetical protein